MVRVSLALIAALTLTSCAHSTATRKISTPAVRGASTPTTITTTSLPTPVTIAWDPMPAATSGFRVYDNGVVLSTVAAGLSQAIVTLATAGTHSFYLTALAGTFESAPSNTVAAIVVLNTPPPITLAVPTNVRVVMATSCASPIGTEGPTITDATCAVWTLGTNGETLRNGTLISNGRGFRYLYLASGVYVLGTDNAWYFLNADSWQRLNAKPTS